MHTTAVGGSLKERVARILQDDELRKELAKLSSEQVGYLSPMRAEVGPQELPNFIEGYSPESAPPGVNELETIVLRFGRPVYLVKGDGYEPPPSLDAESEVWRERLEAARGVLAPAIRATGRVVVGNHPTYDWVGTGWLVADDIIVTNRHVAEVFTHRDGDGLRFGTNFRGETYTAALDFFEGNPGSQSRSFELTEVLHVEDSDGPDMALFRISRDGGTGALASPIALASDPPGEGTRVAVIGYPAQDSRILDPLLMRRIFGDLYNVKRLAPGEVMRINHTALEHDCSTLGGNSGSVVLDLETGEAVALHFAGRYLEANYAVPAALIAERIERFRGSRNGPRRSTTRSVTQPPHRAKKDKPGTPPTTPSPRTAAPPASTQAIKDFLGAFDVEMVNRQCRLKSYRKKTIRPLNVSGEMIAYASPDSTYAVTRRLLEGASQSILIGIYDFTASYMKDLLIRAMSRGVRVSLMLDLDNRSGETDLFRELTRFGCEGVPAPSCASAHAKFFASSHEKVIVIDDEWTLVQSGNYSDNSIPANEEDGAAGDRFIPGNRDMGLAVKSREMAEFFTRILRDDMRLEQEGGDHEMAVERAEAYEPVEILVEAPSRPPAELFASKRFRPTQPVRFTPVLSPDNYMDVVPDLLREARESIRIEQQYIRGNQPHIKTLLSAIAEARENNEELEVQIIVARPMGGGSRFAAEAQKIRDLGRDFGLNLGEHVRLLNPRHFVHCHNKLVVVDDKRVLVGSQNWSDFAVAKNREASLLVEHAPAARYFADIFRSDWETAVRDLPSEEAVFFAPEALSRGGLVPLNWGDYAEV